MTDPITEFRGDHAFLSNFFPRSLTLNGHLYPTAEHAYQALKAQLPQDEQRIRLAPTPGQAKRIGRAVRIRPGWDRTQAMRQVLTAKFSDPTLAALLLATGDRELLEGNTWGDTYWGVCNGRGKNALGQLLMEVRARLAEQARE